MRRTPKLGGLPGRVRRSALVRSETSSSNSCLESPTERSAANKSFLRDMAGIDFNALRNTITMEEVLNQLGFQPVSRTGDQLHGPCLVHGSSSPDSKTFSVNVRMGRYYCHKCQSKGNHLELWAAVHKLAIYDAAVDLCRELSRDVPWITRW